MKVKGLIHGQNWPIILIKRKICRSLSERWQLWQGHGLENHPTSWDSILHHPLSYRCCLDIFEDNVGAADVDHVQATADDQTSLGKVFTVSLFQCCLKPRVLNQLTCYNSRIKQKKINSNSFLFTVEMRPFLLNQTSFVLPLVVHLLWYHLLEITLWHHLPCHHFSSRWRTHIHQPWNISTNSFHYTSSFTF